MADERDERNKILPIPNPVPESAREEDVTQIVSPAPTAIPLESTAVDAIEIAGPVSQIDRKVRAGMFGVPEIMGISISALVLLGVIGFYFLAVAPADRDLKAKKVQRDEMDKKLTETQDRFKKFGTTEAAVSTLNQSVESFEANNLRVASVGRTELYDRINGLMGAYNLRNTAGPEYSPLAIKEFKPDQQGKERGRAEFESLFPGVYINMTVEGNYVSIRRFMHDIEASPQFVVISMVQLEAAENKGQENNPGQPPVGAPGANPNPNASGGVNGGKPGFMPPGTGPSSDVRAAAPKGKNHGDIVSLHMELAAYFRRENQPMLITPTAAGNGK